MAAMDPRDYCSTMAAYNEWMNRRLYDVCARVPEAERRRDRKAFFRSIHGTLNHGLLADRIWLGRFLDRPFGAGPLDRELCADFDELRREREKTDAEILAWARGLTAAALAAPLRFTSIVKRAEHVYPLWACVVHFFNHQTHHRGQLTTLLSQCGEDYGVTDLMWLPGLEQTPGG